LVARYCPDRLILRLGGAVGPGLKKNSIYDLMNNKPLWVNANSSYQYIHTDSIAEIAFKLISNASVNEIINVCGDGPVTLREAMKALRLKTEPVYGGATPPEEHYEINIDKLKTFMPVPKTIDTIRNFASAGAPK